MKTKFLLAAFAALSSTAFSSAGAAEPIIGLVSVIDGDTIEIHGQRMRIWGIDAPESSQLCRGPDSLQFRCGAKAANALADFTAGQTVSCTQVDRDRYGRVVARCDVGGTDMAEWLVRSGHAVDWPRYSRGRYSAAQDEARREERGIWAGSWGNPWEFRACRRAGGRPRACSDGER